MKPHFYRILRSFSFGLCGADLIITLQFISNDKLMFPVAALIAAMPLLLCTGGNCGMAEETSIRHQRDWWLLVGFGIGFLLTLYATMRIFESYSRWYGSALAAGVMASAVIMGLSIDWKRIRKR
jgi:hypothetical protein